MSKAFFVVERPRVGMLQSADIVGRGTIEGRRVWERRGGIEISWTWAGHRPGYIRALHVPFPQKEDPGMCGGRENVHLEGRGGGEGRPVMGWMQCRQSGREQVASDRASNRLHCSLN